LAIRGLVTVSFGLTIFVPDITLVTLVRLFGTYAGDSGEAER